MRIERTSVRSRLRRTTQLLAAVSAIAACLYAVPAAGAAAPSPAARLSAAGERVQWDDSLPGVRRFYTADPWGNRVELLAG